MPKPENPLTSIRLPVELYDEFKIISIRTKVNLQQFTERAMWHYVNNQEFRTLINSTLNTYYTSSVQ